ncbi:sialidase-like [Scylla paramamosain]|uniref:sialidase-like n=1 Tax=Scylla paramamosain TaxID=85552 RepID=UPI003082F164
MVVCPCGVMVPSPGGGRARRGPRTPSCFDTSETVTSQPKDMEEPASVEKLTAANNNEQTAGIPRPASRNSKNKGVASKGGEEARLDHSSRTTLALATTESGRYVGTRPLRSNRSPTPTLHRIPLKSAADQKQAGNGRPSKHLPAVRTSPASPQDPQAAPAHLRDMNRAKVPLAVPRKSSLTQRLNELNVTNQRRLLKQDLSPQKKQLRSASPPSPPLAHHNSPLYQNIVPSTPTTSTSQEVVYENLKPYARTGAKGILEEVSAPTLPATPEPEGTTVWLSESWKYNTIKKAPDFNIFEISDAESSTSRASTSRGSSLSPARGRARNTASPGASDAASSTSRGSSSSPRRDKKKLHSRLPMFIRQRKGKDKEEDATPAQVGRHAPRGDRKRGHHPQGAGSPAGVHEAKAPRAGEKDATNPTEHKGSRGPAGIPGDVPAHKAACQSDAGDGASRASRRLSKALSHNTVSDSSDNEERSVRRGSPRGPRPPPGVPTAHGKEGLAGELDAAGKLMRKAPSSTPSESSDYDPVSLSTGSSWQDLTQDLISDSSDGEGGIWLSQWVQEARSRARASLGSEQGVWAGIGAGAGWPGWERRASPGCSRASPLISPAASLRSLQPGRLDHGDPPPSPRLPLTPPATLSRLRKTHGCPGGVTAGFRKQDVAGTLSRASQALRGEEGGVPRQPGHAQPAKHNNHAHPATHNNSKPVRPVHPASPAHSSADPVSPAHQAKHSSPAHTPVTTKTAFPTTNMTSPAHSTNPATVAHTCHPNTPTNTPNTATTATTHAPCATSPAHSDWRGAGTSVAGAAHHHHHHPQDPSRSLPQQTGYATLPRPHARPAAPAQPLTSLRQDGSGALRQEAPRPLQAPGGAAWRPLSQVIAATQPAAGQASFLSPRRLPRAAAPAPRPAAGLPAAAPQPRLPGERRGSGLCVHPVPGRDGGLQPRG